MGERIRRVAIVGGGPSGAALAAYLQRAGIAATFFTRGKRPPIIVGESLVPAVIPFLRDLGVEDEVAAYSLYKPGATFTFHPVAQMSFRFADSRGARTPYSYNVPRDRFDATIVAAAERAGAVKLEQSAQFLRDGDSDRILLAPEAQAAARDALGGDPDFLVDATGRARAVARMLEIPTVEGPRKDTALHAHCTGVQTVLPGNVHSDRLEVGWSWRIPLPGRVSVGIVTPSEHIARYGASIEEQYDNFLRKDECARQWGEKAERVSPVVRYTNYQLRATRAVGPGWGLVSDAFGFIDPVLSSGTLLAFDGAKSLAMALKDGSARALQRYQARAIRNLDDWARIVDAYYSGRLFTLFKVGEYVRHTLLGRLTDWHFRKHMPRVFTGEATDSRYSMIVVDFMLKYGLAGNDPAEFSIR
ncbi:MAG TPA: NAD(P)/FAD-dependent oxidoreductase [Myxococcota bacterium]|nr:NAD(P)/FAD-dependent oxidoreductase [Myxococcota bacterium]